MSGRNTDRRIARSAFGIALVLFVVLAATTDAPVPPIIEHDPAAARALFATMRAGEQVDAIIDYATARTVPGRSGRLDASITEAKWGRVSLTRSPDTLVVDTPDRTYNCDRFGDTPSCAVQPPNRALPASEVFAVAIATGAYQVTRAPGMTIAGEPARCFRTRAVRTSFVLPGIGEETTSCFADDGVELRTRRVGANSTEERVARRVVRKVDLPALGPVLAGFEKVVPRLSQ